MCMLAVVLFVFTGCTGKADENGSKVSDDGRSYGGIVDIAMGEKAATAFFDVTVDEAVKYDTYSFDDGLYQADAGNTYLVLKLTIKNTYEKELPMSITDFLLRFEGSDEEKPVTGFGNTDLRNADFMDNIFTLKQGESMTKSILFTVPDKEEYILNYTEYYEDEFEGNQFLLHVVPERKSTGQTEPSTDTDAGSKKEPDEPSDTEALEGEEES